MDAPEPFPPIREMGGVREISCHLIANDVCVPYKKESGHICPGDVIAIREQTFRQDQQSQAGHRAQDNRQFLPEPAAAQKNKTDRKQRTKRSQPKAWARRTEQENTEDRKSVV